MLRFSILLAISIALTTAFLGPEHMGRSPKVSMIKGRVELINSTIKPRNGHMDASGVVVWISPPNGGAQRSTVKRRAVINQRDKRFSPHVVVVETGAQVDFPNDDPFFHNVFSVFNGKRFDLGLYASGETGRVIFNRPGISYIYCNIHPQMSAVVLALDSPYYAVTDQQGNFGIAGVPEGRYRLGIWHERAQPEHLDSFKRSLQIVSPVVDLGAIQISEEGYLPRPRRNKYGQEYDHQQNRHGYPNP